MIGSFDFDLRSLEIFVHTVEAGNMTTAAERMGTTQPAISQALTNLEKSLELTLLDRTVRPLEVTAAGRFLYDSARNILAQARKTNGDMRQANYNKLNHVNIAMVDSLVTALAPALIKTVEQHVSGWSISTGLSHLHANALMSRHVDMILSDDALEQHDNLSRYRILREPFVLVVPKSQSIEFKDLGQLVAQLGFIRYSSDSLIGLTVERYLKRAQIDPPMCLKLDNTFAILSSVAAGLGWTITTPLCLFQNGISNKDVTCLPLPGDSLFRNLVLVSRDNGLWQLPKIIANDSQAILAGEFTNYINHHLAWLKEQIKIG
ncbi:MAG: LysR family transcriptional regulator [Gammaproteobacteria bacterium]|nr:LysR family transcriptional regulator [Gammaproteobacteria bacterium]